MKKAKRLITILMTVMLIVSMIPLTAFADTTDDPSNTPSLLSTDASITISRSDSSIDMTKRAFNLYRIFDAEEVSNGSGQSTGIQYKWIDDGDAEDGKDGLFYDFFFSAAENNGTARVEVPEYGDTIDAVIRYINQQNTSAATMVQFSNALYAYISKNNNVIKPVNVEGSGVEVAKSTTLVSYSYLPQGYYLIEDVTENQADEGEVVSSLMLITATGDAKIELKATRPTIDKYVYDVNDVLTDSNGVGTKGASVTVGDRVTYRLSVLIPDVSTYTNGYFFTINDTQGDGMPIIHESTKLYTVDPSAPTVKNEVEMYGDADEDTVADHAHWAIVPETWDEFQEKMDEDALFALLVAEVLHGESSTDTTVTETQYNQYFGGGVILIDLYDPKFTAGDTLEIYYDAIVGDEIMTAGATEAGNSTNTVVLSYTSDPQTPTEDLGTDDSSAQIWSHDFKLMKKAATSDGTATNIALSGVKYMLYKKGEDTPIRFKQAADGSYSYTVTTSTVEGEYVTELDSSESGVTVFYGLGAGSYTLVEIKAPDGYVLPTEQFDFTITASCGPLFGDLIGMGITSTVESAESGKVIAQLTNFAKNDDTNGYVEAVLTNIPAAALPSTGGMGTTLFVVGGIVLMAGAVVILMMSRKRVHK